MRTPSLSPRMHPLFPALRLSLLLTLLLPTVSMAVGRQGRSPQRPTFDASVAWVRVDVIVTHDGRFVDDLRPDEFVLFEDGDEQQILSVQLVDLLPDPLPEAEGAVRAPEEEGAIKAETGAAEGAGAAGEDPADLAALVYVINGLDLGCRGLSRFVRQWGRTFEDVESTAIPHSVYLIDYLGYVHELAEFTRDGAVLRQAVEKIRGKSLYGGEVEPMYASIYGGACFGSPIEAAGRPVRSFELLSAVTDVLAQRPGRKALVWVSRDLGFSERRLQRGRRWDPFDQQRADRVRREFERAANSAGVSVYGIDPGMVTWYTSLGSASSSIGPVDMILRDPFVGSEFATRANSLNEVSKNTGGRAFLRWGDIPRALRQVKNEIGRFYLVTYALPDPPNDGEYHEIRVEVRRPDMRVRARNGYYDISEAERAQRAAAARLLLAEPSPLLQAIKR